jgi:nicotinate dehydrogenase subunit A
VPHKQAGRACTPLRRGAAHPAPGAGNTTRVGEMNSMLMMTVALLNKNPQPTDTEIRQALSANLCRCGTHIEIIAAVHRAAELMKAHAP